MYDNQKLLDQLGTKYSYENLDELVKKYNKN